MRAISLYVLLCTLVVLSGRDRPAFAGDILTLASGHHGAPAYRAGVGLASLIKVELLPSRKIDLQAVDTAGTVDNIRRLQAGAAEFAIVPSVVGHAARTGAGSFEGDAPELGLRGITALWREAIHLVVRTDDVATGTVDDLLMLKDRKLLLGNAATGMTDVNRRLLADLGLDIDEAVEIAPIPNGDGLAAVKRGDIDGFSAAARPPLPTFETVFKETPPGIRLLEVTETQLTRANANHWLWTPFVIPAATYPGQNEDVWTIAFSTLLVVKADVDSDLVYEITKNIFENLAYLQRVDSILADLSLDRALDGMAMPLHPGAMRYFREAGVILDEAPRPDTIDRTTPDRRPETSYPDADVAGDPRENAGGPLTVKAPETSVQEAPEPALPALDPVPVPYWRQRATL